MTTFGSARVAAHQELLLAGLIRRDNLSDHETEGLMIGSVFNGREEHFLRYKGQLHQLIIGGTGGGKFVSALGPLLLVPQSIQNCALIIDPKGEIARALGPTYQRAFDGTQQVLLLDPWDDTGAAKQFGSTLNFFDGLTEDNPRLVDDARVLADAMIVPTGGADSAHWDTTGRNFLMALILFVALDREEKKTRTIFRLRELITQRQDKWKDFLAFLSDSPLADGTVRRGVNGLIGRSDNERAGIISTIERDTAWLESPQMRDITSSRRSLDLPSLAVGTARIHVVIPPEYFMTQKSWLRLIVATFSNAFKRYRVKDGSGEYQRRRHIIIDEFTNLGEMSFVYNDITVARGYDIQYHLATQDFTQLRGVYGEKWETFINATFIRAFALNDNFTTKYLSEMSGTATVQNKSFSSSNAKSESKAFNESTAHNTGSSSNQQGSSSNSGTTYTSGTTDTFGVTQTEGETTAYIGRPVMFADEIRRLRDNEQIIFFRGLPLVYAQRRHFATYTKSLPHFSLPDILGTIGREPRDNSERETFEWQYEGIPLALAPPPPQPRALPPPEPVVVPKPTYRIHQLVLACVAVLLLGFWLWPSSPPPKVAEVIHPPVAPVYVPPPVPAGPPKIPRPEFVRGPNRLGEGEHMQKYQPEWCDRYKSYIRAHMNYCTDTKAELEVPLMNHLIYYAERYCAIPVNAFNEDRTPTLPLVTKWRSENDALIRSLNELGLNMMSDRWIDKDGNRQSLPRKKDFPVKQYADEMFELIVKIIDNPYLNDSFASLASISIRNMYAKGCPFNSIPPEQYVPPTERF
ncbi:MAG: type IV secretory system conjugative DNA transfer family protein [Afipia sp.]|nr:type IV secretory system conjugative DNA transfer family protein [Afipia sp.]